MKSLLWPAVLLFSLCLASCSKSDDKPREKVLYQTSFDKDDGQWSIESYDSIDVSLKGGFYQVTNSRSNYLFEEPVADIFDSGADSIGIEAKIQVAKLGDAEFGGGGLMWGYGPGEEVYFFNVYTDGYFEVFGYPDGSSYESYESLSALDVIKPAGANLLRITLVDGDLHFLINGKEVFSMSSPTKGLDRSGISTESHTMLKADYFKAFRLP